MEIIDFNNLKEFHWSNLDALRYAESKRTNRINGIEKEIALLTQEKQRVMVQRQEISQRMYDLSHGKD